MAESMFDGFDHTQHRREVEERWGAEAYAASDAWWRGTSRDEKTGWQAAAELAADWVAAAASGIAPESAGAQQLARRHVAWLAGIPGTPGASRGYVLGLAEMYVADERFAANYGGVSGARFVRDALTVYADAHL